MFSAICYLCLSVTIGLFFDHKQITIYTVLRLTQAIAIRICADFLAKSKEPKWWMKMSFFIYLCHNMVLESVEKGFLIALGMITIGAFWDFILAPVFALAIIVALAFWEKAGLLWKDLPGRSR